MEKETKELEAVQLPENAFRELKEGEEYEPVMSPSKVYPEVNSWSVIWGISWLCFSRLLPLIWD